MALGYLLDNYSPQQQAELQIGSVVGDKLGDRFPWLDRAAIVAVGGSLAIATAQAYQPRLAQADDASLPVRSPVLHLVTTSTLRNDRNFDGPSG